MPKKRLSERPDLIQVKSIKELSEGMNVHYEDIPGGGRIEKIENKENPNEQRNYRSFWRTVIGRGIVYKKGNN